METVNILAQVRDGMTVYDHNGDSIGTVRLVRMSDEMPDQPGPETASTTTSDRMREDSLIDDIADAFTHESRLTEELRARLLHQGFVRIDLGVLRADRFALPDQISSVSDEDVHLNVAADDLIKS
jgi:hypothetical protein